ncbi:PPM-type phosphatase domain [Sesbania bispinosa]|nr:PPM-type phosphatase domain [Sesbania bispinosa]
MADLFSRSFHCLWVPCRNLPPKPSERLGISAPIPLHKRRVSFTQHTHMLANSSSSQNPVPEDVDLLTSTVCSDGSFVFRFGNASEIREKIDELAQEKLARETVEEGGVKALLSDSVEKVNNGVDHNLGEEIESSSIAAVAIADDNPQLLVNEKQSVVLDNDPETPVINDSRKIDRRLELDSVEDGEQGILSEDAADECNDVPSVSEEEPQVDGHNVVAVSIVIPESNSDILSDQNSDAAGEVDEKIDDGHKVVVVSTVTPELGMLSDRNSASGEVEDKVDDGHKEVSISEVTPESDMFSDLNSVASGEVEEKVDGQEEEVVSTVTPESDMFSELNTGACGEVEGHEEVSISTVTPESDMFSDLNSGASGKVEEKVDGQEEVAVSTVTPESDMLSDLNTGASGEVEEKVDGHEEVAISTVTPESDMSSDLNSGAFGVVEEKVDGQEEVAVSTVTPESDMFSDLNSVAFGEVEEKVDGQEEVAVSTVTPESDMFSDLNSGASGEVEEKVDGHAEVAISTVTPESDMSSDHNSGASGEVEEKVDGQEVVISTVTPESDMSSDLNSGASGEVEEKVDGHEEVAISTVTPESDMSSDLNSGASGEVEEKEVDKGHDMDGATNNPTDGVDADLSELVPVSTSLESIQAVNRETNNLMGGVNADLNEMLPLSTSLESELVANDEETTHRTVDDSIDANKMGKSAMLHDSVASSDLENKLDVGNTERGKKTSRTELFLVSGAACLPHPSKALTGREDGYFISHKNWLAVADGVGHWSHEGSTTGLYIRELMEKCENIVSDHENNPTIKPAEVLTRSAAETQSPGSSSVLVAYFDGQALHAANVGNTGFIIIRDGSIFKKSMATFHEFCFPLQIVKGDDPSEIIEGYKIDLEDGDVIIFATNGLFDNLYEQEIASTISKSLQASLRPQNFGQYQVHHMLRNWVNLQEIAEILAMRAQEVGRSTSTRSPFADAAQAVGYVGYTGGKLDDVTVVVSLVQT